MWTISKSEPVSFIYSESAKKKCTTNNISAVKNLLKSNSFKLLTLSSEGGI